MTHRPKTKVDELRETLDRKHKADEQKQKNVEVPVEETSGGTSSEKEDGPADDITTGRDEVRESHEKLLRVMAEFENFKKRMNREREEQFKYAGERLLSDLLPALDDLDRVLDHVAPEAPDDVRKMAEGIELVRKGLLGILERHGLKEVPAQNEPFDPTKHEAIAMVESDAFEPGHVMAVHRKGYYLFDRLLRPAMVTVAKAKEEAGQNLCKPADF